MLIFTQIGQIAAHIDNDLGFVAFLFVCADCAEEAFAHSFSRRRFRVDTEDDMYRLGYLA